MKRRDLQALANARLRDAEILLQNRRFDGAYYLAGYAVECAIKACVAKKTQRYDFPDRNLALDVYVHDLTKLLKPAGLDQVWQRELNLDPELNVRWGVVKDWTEQSRYETQARQTAKDMVEAVGGAQGILECIKNIGSRVD
jgi:HEPN domain-containing protein